ncbi:MAG: hypothetical protein [Podoviridae sp. ctpVR23]|nr:MAG: hypothetical protein [Podoviridae sp. ctpVR23]
MRIKEGNRTVYRSEEAIARRKATGSRMDVR